MATQTCTYRLWDSDIGYVDIPVNGWLEDAIVAAQMPFPHRAQFWCNETEQWLDVLPSALSGVVRRMAA